MQRRAIFILRLTISSTFSTPLTFDFNIVDKQSLNLASFSEAPTLSVDIEDQGIQGEFCFGTKSQCFDMLIDLNSLTSWVADSSNPQKKIDTFSKEDSSSCKVGRETDLIYEDGRKVSGTFVQDKMSIDRSDVGAFNFVSASNSDAFSGINGMIAMGYSQSGNDDKFAFLSQLKENNVIQHKVITIEFKKNSGQFTIGKLPKEAVNDYNNYGTCDLTPENKADDSNKRAWYCNVNGIIIGKNKKTDIVYDFATKKAKFDLTVSRTIVPIAYLLRLEREYFTKQIESGECNFGFKSVGTGYYAFTCESDNYDLSDITIMFDKWGINIPQDQLFTYDSVDKEYEFVLYGKDGYDGFAIGTNIMKNYIMVFDESNQNIGFYSQTNLVKFTNEDLNPPKSYEDGSKPSKPPLIPEEGEGGKKPLIKDDDDNNNKPLISESGDKENEGGYRPPTLIDPGKPGTVIPQEEEGFWGKFFKTIGMLLLILGLVFVGWLGFRYYRRKKYSDPTYYYKVTDEMFNEGTPLE